MIRASDYSQIVVKAASERSRLIGRKQIENLAESRDLNEFVSRLKGSPYEPLLKNIRHLSARKLQHVFREELARVCSKMVRFSPKETRFFLEDYISYFEIENLKALLKMKHVRVPADVLVTRLHLLVEEIFGAKERFIQAAKAEDVKAAVETFKGTMYEPILSEGLARYEETGSTKFFDFSLDRAYHDKLLVSARLVPTKDREIALQFAGLKVDMFNIITAVRSNILRYPSHQVYRAITHRFYKLNEKNIRDLVLSENLDSALNLIKQSFYGRFLVQHESVEDVIIDFERKIKSFSLKSLEKKRIINIFSVATPLDLIAKKEKETENLTVISSGIEFGWEPENLISALV